MRQSRRKDDGSDDRPEDHVRVMVHVTWSESPEMTLASALSTVSKDRIAELAVETWNRPARWMAGKVADTLNVLVSVSVEAPRVWA